jgi:CubicO group peptidase (beta-lactamase class C family)
MIRRASYVAAQFAAVTAIALALAPAPYAHAQTAAARTAAARAPALQPAASPESVGFDSARLKRLDEAMAEAVASGRVAGMTTLLARHGKVVSFNTYGVKDLSTRQPVTKDTMFRIYSMTKPVTGVAMMILFEEGKWRLDDPITRYIPEFTDLKVMTGQDSAGRPILEPMKRPPTMRDVMSHTAGFGYGLNAGNPLDKMYQDKQVLQAPGMQAMIQRIAELPLAFQPGEQWRYSIAVDIQGALVERISGQTLGQFFADRIFQPLKMNDTGFQVPAAKAARLSSIYDTVPNTTRVEPAIRLFGGAMPDYTKAPNFESGGAGLVSTTMDYARFAQMLVNGGELDGVRILSPASVEMMSTNMLSDAILNSGGRFNDAVGFGLDVQVVNKPREAGSLEGEGTISWNGAAGTWFWSDPTNDVVFVGMVQRLGGTGGDPLGAAARTLTYQALVDPAK